MASQQAPDEPKWSDIAPHVDQALAELPDDLRVPLVLYYMESKQQSDIADQIGIPAMFGVTAFLVLALGWAGARLLVSKAAPKVS